MKDILDLLAVVLHLRALKNGRIPATHGQIIHGAFISLLMNLFPRLPEGLHGGNSTPRPFTLSHLHCPTENQKGENRRWELTIPIIKGEDYWFRITSLSREMSVLLFSLCQDPPSTIELAHLPFHLVGISRKGHPRAGQNTYQELWEDEYNNSSKLKTIQGFYFLSTTTFHSQKRNFLFPLPALIFPQLIKRWNLFSPDKKIPPFQNAIFEQSLMVSAYKLHTHILDFGTKGKEIGFEGYCEYKTEKNTDLEVLKIIHLLGRYSFFSGIGYGTTKGLGQVSFAVP